MNFHPPTRRSWIWQLSGAGMRIPCLRPLPHPNPQNDLSGDGSGHVGDFLTPELHEWELSPHHGSCGPVDLMGVASEVLGELQEPDVLTFLPHLGSVGAGHRIG
jgi:hypothetical protein